MRTVFVEDLSNVKRFMAGTTRVEKRGAIEACWQLVEGDPGYGKTKTLGWWANQNDAPYLRAKSGWTLNWALRDLVTELGEKPQGRSEHLFNQALQRIARTGKPIIVDEIEHTLHDRRVIEMLRDISDLTATPIIIGGMSGVSRSLRRFDQIYSRIADVTLFEACTIDDVRICAHTLIEGTGAHPDMIAEIHRRTAGRLREVMNAIAEVERYGRKHGKKEVGVGEMPLPLLTNDGRARSASPRRVA